MTVYTATTAEQGFLAPTQKTSAALTLLENGQTFDTSIPVFKYGATLADSIIGAYAQPSAVKAINLTTANVIYVHENVPTYAFRPGVTINEVIRAQAVTLPNLKYAALLADQHLIRDAISCAFTATLSDAINVHQVETLVRAILVLEGLNLTSVLGVKATYGQIINELIRGHEDLFKFLGASFGESIFVHDTLSRTFRAQPVVADAINLTSVLSSKLLLSVTSNESIRVSPTQALTALYSGTLIEGAQITAGYVSPSGNFTTWAMNARTAAVTEYSNYAFNSFGRLGNKYIGARADGLYELSGNTDAGASIIADIKSGFAQWSSTHLGSIRNAYLATKGGGNFVLKIITGEGLEVLYSLTADNMQSTKIHIGKGLRTRYFAFELISTGQDFDLDTLEFVPLVVQRRV